METSLEQFRRTTDGACGVSREQRIVFWNRAAQDLLGFREREVLGRPCYEVMCGLDEAGRQHCRLGCPLFRLALEHGIVPTCNLRVRTRDAEERLLSITTIQIPADRAVDTALVHLFRDVTRYQELEDSVTLLRAHLAGSVEGERNAPASSKFQPRLTPRERELLHHLASGRTTHAIAEAMVVSPATVRNHVHNVFVKLHAHSRLEAVMIAARLGVL